MGQNAMMADLWALQSHQRINQAPSSYNASTNGAADSSSSAADSSSFQAQGGNRVTRAPTSRKHGGEAMSDGEIYRVLVAILQLYKLLPCLVARHPKATLADADDPEGGCLETVQSMATFLQSEVLFSMI
jgi:hypothetical protein